MRTRRSILQSWTKLHPIHSSSSAAARISSIQDIPGITGSILWARQIERRLGMCLKKTEDVLGRGWDQHVEGSKIRQSVEAFAKKLNVAPVFESWLKDLKETKQFDLGRERLFGVVVQAKK